MRFGLEKRKKGKPIFYFPQRFSRNIIVLSSRLRSLSLARARLAITSTPNLALRVVHLQYPSPSIYFYIIVIFFNFCIDYFLKFFYRLRLIRPRIIRVSSSPRTRPSPISTVLLTTVSEGRFTEIASCICGAIRLRIVYKT